MKAAPADGQPAQAAPWNQLNPLIGTGPAILETGLLRCPDGVERLVATVKHRMGELTLMLDWNDADTWLNTLAETHAQQSQITTANAIPGEQPLPNMPGNGHQPGS